MYHYTKHVMEKMDGLGIDKKDVEKSITKGMKWKEEIKNWRQENAQTFLSVDVPAIPATLDRLVDAGMKEGIITQKGGSFGYVIADRSQPAFGCDELRVIVDYFNNRGFDVVYRFDSFWSIPNMYRCVLTIKREVF